MRLLHNIVLGVILAGLLFTASCNFLGLDDGDDTLNLPHNEGGGENV